MTKKERIGNLTKEECLALIKENETYRGLFTSLFNSVHYKQFHIVYLKEIFEKYSLDYSKFLEKEKHSPIWKVSREAFIKMMENSISVKDMLSYFGMQNHGSNFKTLKRRFEKEGLDYKSFVQRSKRICTNKKYSDEELFSENSEISRGTVRRRLITYNLIDYSCQICKRKTKIINNKKETLVLDHINGVNNDHRLENLRFVCGSCDLQLETASGKNGKNRMT